jgi:hypothetical protein
MPAPYLPASHRAWQKSQDPATQVRESAAMGKWRAQTFVAGEPDDVLAILTEPDIIARWAPIDFELADRCHGRLKAGDLVRVRGFLAGRCLEFMVDVANASDGRLSLTATGPIALDVEYVARPTEGGSLVHAVVGVSGRGLIGRMLAQATDALLAAGALTAAVGRIGRELDEASPTQEFAPALAA